jgi:hypothetical protein
VLSRCFSKPQRPSDGTCATPRLPSLKAVIYFSKPFACCLGSHPAGRRAYASFRRQSNNSQSQTLIASLQLQKVTGLQSDLPLFPPCRQRPKPRVGGAEDLRLLPAALRCKERVNHRASGRGQGFCTRLQQRSLAGASSLHYSHILSTPITLNPPSSHPMLLRSLNHLAGKQTSYSTT